MTPASIPVLFQSLPVSKLNIVIDRSSWKFAGVRTHEPKSQGTEIILNQDKGPSKVSTWIRSFTFTNHHIISYSILCIGRKRRAALCMSSCLRGSLEGLEQRKKECTKNKRWACAKLHIFLLRAFVHNRNPMYLCYK